MKSIEVDPHLPDFCEAEVQELDLLKRYSSQCTSVTEFGVHDCTSTWALLAGRPKKLTSYDIGDTSHPYYGVPGAVESEVNRVKEAAPSYGTEFRFVLGNSMEIEIEETEMLFIDSSHSYANLKKELSLHQGKVRRFIGFHDTTTFEVKDESGQPGGLWPAIQELLDRPEGWWKIRERLTNYNGITVLERVA
jgi:hypothetical protein